MTRRRPGTLPTASGAQRQPIVDPASKEGSGAVWYAVLIGAVLLIATGLYAAHLYQQVEEWRSAANQLTVGQEMLRFDRDEILEKVREREVTLATLEAAREQDRSRLDVLENQRQRLQSDVLRLTQQLARNEQQASGKVVDDDQTAALEKLQRERDRLDRALSEERAEIVRLESRLAELDLASVKQAETLEAKDGQIEEIRALSADLEQAKAVLEQDRERLEQALEQRRLSERKRQIIRGHRASLGEVKPYITELGPQDWGVIESWLALQLRRPMAVPDLSEHGWSYEGARLLGSSDGPPIAMLLYADAEERPASLTIVRDGSGAGPLDIKTEGGLDLLEWREERHAFYLASEAEEETLTDIAIELQNQPPRLSDDAAVPVSRYIRPVQRPSDLP
ncbi:MAG: hypothetical protein AAGA21_03185 [Pseudomonadota bacterium]